MTRQARSTKKDAMLAPIRIPSELKEDYFAALAHYGISRPQYARYCIRCLIGKYKRGEELHIKYD